MSDNIGLLELIQRAHAERDPGLLCERIPYARFMNIEVLSDGDGLIGIMRYEPFLIGNTVLPALHGGTLGGLLEFTAQLAVVWARPTARLPRTVTLTIDYLRPGRPEDTFARAEIQRHGRRVASVLVDAWQSDSNRTIASARVHLLL